MLEIEQIPVLTDNYIYLIHEPDSGATAVVDPAQADPVSAALEARGWRLTHILNTHHHWDHIGANQELKERYGCTVVAAKADRGRIPGQDEEVVEGETVALGEAEAVVLEVPGHTLGHIAYYFEDDNALFCGDTLFVMGCGRLFEGDAEQMWRSLQKLKRLPGQTRIFCAHEYTQSNARFAASVEPGNHAVRQALAEVVRLRSQDRPTVPSTLERELATNPFLRTDSTELQENLGLPGGDPVAVFAEARRRKDHFKA